MQTDKDLEALPEKPDRMSSAHDRKVRQEMLAEANGEPKPVDAMEAADLEDLLSRMK